MTVTATEPPKAFRSRRHVPLTPMREKAAQSIRRLAKQVEGTHPDMTVHTHLRDAARVLESGNEEGAQRHLRAAAFSLSPLSLMRHGIHDDEGHIAARGVMHGVHRHLLLVKDIVDANAKNQAAIRRDSYGDDTTSNPVPKPLDPNAGYGPGALAAKPTARQPGGDRALNAPDRVNSGGSDPAVADPVGAQPRGSKQFATWGDVDAAIELSAKTAALEVTPAPYGKPGGPGLYNVKGMKHSDYFEQIVKALMEKRGMDKGRASAIAYGALKKWSAGGGKVHPEVRAAATGALAEEKAKGAMAKAVHGHAVTWDDHAMVIEFVAAHPARVISLVGPEGFVHGWKFVGAPGSAEHSSFLRSYAGKLDSDHPGTGAGDSLRKAASAMDGKDFAAAHQHVSDAYDKVRAAPAGGSLTPAGKAKAANLAELDRHYKMTQGLAAQNHAVSWDQVSRRIELATVLDFYNPAGNPGQARVPAGQVSGGQFTAGQQQGASQGKQQAAPAKGKAAPAKGAPAKGAPAKPTAHQQHVAHVQHQQTNAQKKAGLLQTAQTDRAKASQLIQQRNVLMKALASASGKTSSGQAGSTTSSNATTKSTAPAAATTAASTAAKTSTSSATASKTSSSAASTTAASSGSTASMSATQIKAQIGQLNTQINGLLQAAAQAQAQAAKL